MKRFLLALAIVLLLMLPYAFDDTAAQPDADHKPTEVDPQVEKSLEALQEGEMITVIVTLHEQADLSQIPGAGRAARQQGVIRALQAKSYTSQKDIRRFLNLMSAQGKVSHMEPFWIFNGLSITASAEVILELTVRGDVASITPDEVEIDPSPLSTQSGPETNLTAIKAPELWAMGYNGSGVIVANLDSGVDGNHPDLSGGYRGGTNSWFDPYGQHPNSPIDLTGHGTSTMGVMVGGDAGGTAIGVAPQAQWIAARIWNDSGSSTATAIHQAFQWLLDPDGNPATADGPHVVNNSWASSTPGCDLEFESDLQSLRAAGILPVFAGGNYGPSSESSRSPANNPGGFAVGGVDSLGLIYPLSSRGSSACDQTIYPDLVAPGVNIYTADLFDGYVDSTGTSLSAPHAAGGLALLISAFPDVSAGDQEAALINGAADLGPVGPDNDYGNGQIDLLASYQWLLNNQFPATPTPLPSMTPDPNINLALNRPASASSYRDESTTPGEAVDGSQATMWRTKKASGKNKLTTEWIKIDLGSSFPVSRIELKWGDYYATNYDILVSDNEVSWTIVNSIINGSGGTDSVTFPAVQARYIMMDSSAWINGSQRNWLKEFEIFVGSGGQAATATPTLEPTSTPIPLPTATPTPAPGSDLEIHVGDLQGMASSGSRNRWTAGVEVTIHDVNESPVPNAVVSGSWSDGASGGGSCTSNAAGQCSISKNNIKNNVGSVLFTVGEVSHSSMIYQPADNHDNGGDGSIITIYKP